MKTEWILLVIGGSGALLLTERTLAQSVAYDNTATYLGTAQPAYIEDGSEITLAGSGWVVTSVSIAVEIAGKGPATIPAQLTLYANDGEFDGSPGTLLWASAVISQQIEPGGPRFIRFAVPRVRVPNTFIWTAQFHPRETQVSFSQFHPPVVGSVRFGFWWYSLGAIPWVFSEAWPPFGAVVTVQPAIPTVSEWGALLMTLALMGAGAVIISRANRRGSAARTLRGAGLLPVLCFLPWAFPALGQVQVGPQIRIDDGGNAAANETSIASSNFNPNEIVAAWNDYRESTNRAIVRIYAGVSNDGGATWSEFLVRPPAHQSNVETDPMTAYDDRTGTLWVGGFSIPFGGVGGVFVARKNPGQPAFEAPVMAYTGFADKGWMAAGSRPGDPNATNLYIAFNQGVICSTDMGDTWSEPVPLELPGDGIGYLPRVGPNGELYVAYWDYEDGVILRSSFDGGQMFGPPITIATRNDVWPIQDILPPTRFPGTFRVPPFNYLAVDQNDGTLYCVYFDTTNIVGGICNGNCNVDLYFTKSTNQGWTWTTPVVINGDSNPPGDQFFPWIEVDEESNLHMVFLDSRHTVQSDNVVHGMFDAYYSFSNDGGATWQEFRLTSESFDSENDGLNRSNQFLGDYLGLARGRDRVYPCYLSTSPLTGDPNIYTHVITILGGCCLADSCAELSEDSCASQGGTFLGAGTICTGLDCNCNDVPDECDIYTATSLDENNNGIPDECDASTGACCNGEGACIIATECSCPGYFFGVGTYCPPGIECSFDDPQLQPPEP